jgi:Tfp pilus assembly protein PilV
MKSVTKQAWGALLQMLLRLGGDEGFTIIEALVSAVVLVVGLLTTFLMLNVSVRAASDVQAREGAVTLTRQITEDARSIPYSQIGSATLVGTLQAMPGLANSSSGSNWTIVRNGLTYTITVTMTPAYDSKDPANATGNDIVDFKQVAITVSWTTFSGLSHSYSETTTLTRAGQDPGLAASALALASPTSGYAGTSTAPVITSSSTTSLTFSVTAPTGTSAIVWTLNGAKQSAWAGSAPSSGTTWTSNSWTISSISDGTYTVGAQAEDAYGVDGPAVTITVRLIRNVPSAPVVTAYGFNTHLPGASGTAAEFQWNSNSQLNVVGYRIYNPSGTMICQTSTTTSYASCGSSAWCLNATECIDLNPPSTTASNLAYQIKALYYNASNVLSEGSAASVTLASGTPVPPGVPTNLSVASQLDGSAILTWTPPSSGTAVSFYWIYRGGDNYADRYDIVPASSCSTTCTFHDTARTASSSYWVTAVGGTTPGSNMAESTAVGPVTG